MKKAFLTGATGAFGPVLLCHLIERGYHVTALVREASDCKMIPWQVDIVVGDVKNQGSFKDSLKGMDIVFHLAAVLHQTCPPQKFQNEYVEVNVKGTLNVVEAAQAKKVKRVVLFSTVALYDSGEDGVLVNEEARLFPYTSYEKTKLDGELSAMNFGKLQKTSPEITILRLASVYGKRVKGNYKKMINLIRKGFWICPGEGNNLRTLIHEEDAARAAIIAAEHPRAAWEVFNVTDGKVHTVREIVKSISEALDQKIIEIYLPDLPFKRLRYFLIRSSDRYRSVFPLLFKFSFMLEKINENCAVDGSKIEKMLGFKPKWELTCGMRQVLNSYSCRSGRT